RTAVDVAAALAVDGLVGADRSERHRAEADFDLRRAAVIVVVLLVAAAFVIPHDIAIEIAVKLVAAGGENVRAEQFGCAVEAAAVEIEQRREILAWRPFKLETAGDIFKAAKGVVDLVETVLD